MDLKFRFMLMNDHFSIQILSEPGFNVFLGVESEIGIMGTLHFTLHTASLQTEPFA